MKGGNNEVDKKKKKKLVIVVSVFALLILSDAGRSKVVSGVSNSGQTSPVEYAYDGNNRLTEVKKEGATIAVLSYDNNGNLIRIRVVE